MQLTRSCESCNTNGQGHSDSPPLKQPMDGAFESLGISSISSPGKTTPIHNWNWGNIQLPTTQLTPQTNFTRQTDRRSNDHKIPHAHRINKAKKLGGSSTATKLFASLEFALKNERSFTPEIKSNTMDFIDELKGMYHSQQTDNQPTESSHGITHPTKVSVADSSIFSSSASMMNTSSVFSQSDCASGSQPTYSRSSASQPVRTKMTNHKAAPRLRSQRGRNSGKVNYYCTFPECESCFKSRLDWIRHEESEKHYPQKRFMCLVCINPILSDGFLFCEYCLVPLEDLAQPKDHSLTCDSAQAQAQVYSRKDHMRSHLRGHGISDTEPLLATWIYTFDSLWPKECGFCGCILTQWDNRMRHLEEHFRAGKDLSTWKIPYPKSLKIMRPKGKDADRDDENHDDDQEDGYRGPYDPHVYMEHYNSNDFMTDAIDGNELFDWDEYEQTYRRTSYQRSARNLALLRTGILASSVEVGELAGFGSWSLHRHIVDPISRAPGDYTAPSCLNLGTIKLSESALINVPGGPTPLEIYLKDLQFFDGFLLRWRDCERASSSPIDASVESQPAHPNIVERSRVDCLKIANPDTCMHSEPGEYGLRPRRANSLEKYPHSQGRVSSSGSSHKPSMISSAFRDPSSVSSVSSLDSDLPGKAIRSRLYQESRALASVIQGNTIAQGLPCEFEFVGCDIQFNLTDPESWISHSLSHFGRLDPPANMGCTFCTSLDKDKSGEPTTGIASWRERMLHIAKHYAEGVSEDDRIPCQDLVGYLWDNKLLSVEDYLHALRFIAIPGREFALPVRSIIKA